MAAQDSDWMRICPVCSHAGDLAGSVVAEDNHTYCQRCITAWNQSRLARGEKVVSAASREPMGEAVRAANPRDDRCVEALNTQTARSIESLRAVFAELNGVRDVLNFSLSGWEPPKVVMIGLETTGKSSVMERLAMMPLFPRGNNLTTRIPIVVRLRNSETATPPRLEVVNKTTEMTEVGPYDVPMVSGHIDVSKAMDDILREEQRKLPQQRISLTHMIVLHVESPSVPSVDLVDLPGLVTADSHGGNQGAETTKLLEEQIEQHGKNSIYLLTCHASSAPNTSWATRVLLEKQLEARTVGIFTMCDETSPRQRQQLLERMAPIPAEDRGAVPLAPHGWIATMNAPVERSDNLRRMREQADAEDLWMSEHMPDSLADRVGGRAVIERVDTFLQEYLRETWAPSTLDLLLSELRNTDAEEAVFRDCEVLRIREMALKEAGRVLGAGKAGVEESFCRQVLGPLKAEIAAALEPALTQLPMEAFARGWAAQRAAVDAACATAASRWAALAEQSAGKLLDQPSALGSAGADEQPTRLASSPLVLGRFEAFVKAIKAELQASTAEQVGVAMADAREHVRGCFQGLLSDAKPSISIGEDGRASVSMQACGERLAEGVAFAFVCAYSQQDPTAGRLERAAGACVDAEWERACVQARQDLAQRRTDLQRGLEAVERMLPAADRPIATQVQLLCKGMREALGDEDAQLRGCQSMLELTHTTGIHITVMRSENWVSINRERRDELELIVGTIVESGAVDALQSAMQAHPASALVQAAACEAIFVLTRYVMFDEVRFAGCIESVIPAIRTHAQTPAVLEHACRALGSLAYEDEEDKITRLQGAKAVVAVMQGHPESAAVQEHACRALDDLAAGHINCCEEIVDAGGIEAVFEAIQGHPNSALQHVGWTVLGSILEEGNDENTIKITGMGGIAMAVDGMRANPNSAEVQEAGTHFLVNLANANSANNIAIADSGGIEAVMDAMRGCPESLGVNEAGCLALQTFAANANNQIKIAGLGGVEVVAKVMTRFSRNLLVRVRGLKLEFFLAQGFKALLALAAKAENGIADAGVRGEAVLQVMRDHPDSAVVQAQGCKSLREIVGIAENKVKIVRLGGAKVVVEAMRGHPESTAVQAVGCGILRDLSQNADEERIKIAGAGAIEAVVEAMRGHPESVEVQEHGCEALQNLARHLDDNRIKIAGIGGVKAVVEAMRGHPESGAVQSTGCYTLWALALNDVAKKTILGVGGIEAVVEAMQGHLESAAVQASGCGALCNLDNSSATKSCIKIVSLGGLDVVVKAMRSHSKSETVQKLGCIALKNAAFNPDNKMKIAAVHGVEAVVEAMQGHPKSEVVQKAGCQALRKLAANADNQIKIAGVGGMEALVEAVRNHLESAEVQKVGFQVLRTFASNNNNKIKIAGLPGIRLVVEVV